MDFRQETRSRLLAGVLLLMGGAGGYGQSTGAKEAVCGGAKSGDTKPCPAREGTPSAKQQFPFPGEAMEPDAPSPARSSPGPSSSVPPTGSGVKDRFPYPGEATPPDLPADAAATSGASSSSGTDGPPPDVDDKPGLKDEGTEGTTARGRRRLRPPAQKTLSDDERVAEDLSVAEFYRQSGNLTGAYLRVKDAVKVQPQAADVHLALAEVSQKLGKRDEAIAEYTRYLEMEPDGEGSKAARKNLERLKP